MRVNAVFTRASFRVMKPITFAIPALICACVTTGTYNKKVAELTKLHDQDVAAANERERAQNARIAELEKGSIDLQTKLIDAQAALDKASSERTALQKKLDDGTQLVTTMKERLEKLGQNVDGLVKERSQLAQAMADTNARLEELRKQKAAADARAAQYRAVVARLRSMIDSHQLQVAIRGGRMIIALPNDVLFESGRTDVKSDGKAALAKVALALAPITDRSFLVAGHTDNVPIKTELFPSNWELSTRRAVEVVHYLVSQGMNPKLLAAAGYGEFDPVAPNDTVEHRAQNRRIEIVLQPNLSDLPPLDDAVAK
ncbi:MAG TPA: OmpA family protein [Kofleriaceae bacterium]|nr:OmpA family protein [Kofleriaceae bacterium]